MPERNSVLRRATDLSSIKKEKELKCTLDDARRLLKVVFEKRNINEVQPEVEICVYKESLYEYALKEVQCGKNSILEKQKDRPFNTFENV